MAEFSLCVGGVFQEIRRLPARPINIPHKGVTWFPVVREYGEPFEGVEDDNYVVRTVNPATLPPPVPGVISDRQFFEQMAEAGLATQEEAEAAVATGTLPASLAELVGLLPEQARFKASMLLKGATQFYRDHEMTDTIAWLYGWTGAQVDDFFRDAGRL